MSFHPQRSRERLLCTIAIIISIIAILSLVSCSFDKTPTVTVATSMVSQTGTAKTVIVAPSTKPFHPTAQPTGSPNPSTATTFNPIPSASIDISGCLSLGGQYEHGAIETELLRQPLEFRIYLPACYLQEPERRYPVLYLIHGQSYNDDQWDRLGADEVANTLIATHQIPPLIIVMPRDRLWELPNLDLFGQALIEVLIPYIDEHFHTIPDRKYRAIGGLSRGAGWAIHLGLSHWEYFGAIGAHSLPVFKSDTPHLAQWIDAIPHEDLPRIYIDIGNKDRPPILSSAIWFEKLLTQKGIPHEWYLNDGYHEEAYWQSHLEQYLRWYTQDW